MTTFRFVAAAALSAALLFGQGPGGGRRPAGTPPDPATMIQTRVDHLSTLLGLSDSQKASALKIFTDAGAAMQAATADVAATHDALAAAVKQNDIVAIDQAAATLGTIHGTVTSIQSKAEAAFYALLNPEQQAKYDSMPHRGPGMGGGMGPGGMGPQGMRMARPNR